MSDKTIKTLYLVDDDDIFRDTSTKFINKSKLVENIEGYANGVEAIDALKKSLASGTNIPNLILLDLNMPIMDGWEFLQEFNTLSLAQHNIKVYIITSSINEVDFDRANHEPLIKGYIIKPITAKTLKELFNKTLEVTST